MSDWFVRQGSKDIGPFTAKQLVALAQKGSLKRDHPVRKGTTGEWVKASRIKGLFESVPPPSNVPTSDAPRTSLSHDSLSSAVDSAEEVDLPLKSLRDMQDEPLEELQPWVTGAQAIAITILIVLFVWNGIANARGRQVHSTPSGSISFTQMQRVPHLVMLVAGTGGLLGGFASYCVSGKLYRRRRERMLVRAQEHEDQGFRADVCAGCNGAGYSYYLSHECRTCLGVGYSVSRRDSESAPVEIPKPYPGLWLSTWLAILGFLPVLGLLFGALAFIRARRASKEVNEHPNRYIARSRSSARFAVIVGGITVLGNGLLIVLAVIVRLLR